MQSRKVRSLSVLLTALLLLTATACGGSTTVIDEDLGPDEVLAAAVERSTTVDTARMRISTVTSTPQGQVTVRGEGVGGPEGSQMTATLEGALSGTGPTELEMRMVDGVVYQRSEALRAALGTDATWIAFDIEAALPGFEQMVEQAQQLSPAEALAQLRDVARVSEIGPETVNGLSTRHYTALATLRAAFEASGLDQAAIDQYVEATGVDLDQDVPMEVWIDDEGLIRRQRVMVTVQGVSTDTTIGILEYGVDVEVTAPPADVTVSIDELVPQGQGG